MEIAGLYVHVPFCHSKCAYCDFYSMPDRGADWRQRFAYAVKRELEMRRDAYCAFSTIYIGGGTPSILGEKELEVILSDVDVSQAEEFTIEVNPEDVSPEKVALWARLGVNRVSMGVQSLADAELRAVGRRHNATQAIEAFRVLRQGGVSNISLDLIYGLPGQDLASWRRSLEGALDMNPEHLSAYSLTYEPRTRLAAMLRKGEIKEAGEEEVVAMYELLIAEAAKVGYDHYEISNFGKPGFHSRHNSSYWDATPYLGLGPGAHSFDGVDRYSNFSSLKRYVEDLEARRLPTEKEEETPTDRFNDLIVTALRTSRGLCLDLVPAERLSRLLRDASPHLASGALAHKGSSLVIPERQWLMADAVMRDLIQL